MQDLRLRRPDENRNGRSRTCDHPHCRFDGVANRFQRAQISTGTSDSKFIYGAFGLLRQQKVLDGTSQTDITYDVLGRQFSVTRSGTATRWQAFNAFGDITFTGKQNGTGPQVEALAYGRDKLGRLTSITGLPESRTFHWDAPAASPTTPAPNAKGKLVEVKNGTLTQVHFDYETNGLVSKKTWHTSVWGPLTEAGSASYGCIPGPSLRR